MVTTRFTMRNILIFGIVTLCSNFVGTYVGSRILNVLLLPFVKLPAVWFNLIGVLIMCPVILFLSYLVIFFHFKKVVPNHYIAHEDKYLWLKNCLIFTVPGEIFRMILCTFSLGQIKSTGMFGYLPTMMFEYIYLDLSGRSNAVRLELDLIFGDFVAFILCYLVYAAVYMVLLAWIYRFFWKKREKERLSLMGENAYK